MSTKYTSVQLGADIKLSELLHQVEDGWRAFNKMIP